MIYPQSMTEEQHRLAHELAEALDDEASLAWYETVAQGYRRQFLKDTLLKVLLAPNVRNRGAYFNRLVQINGKPFKIRNPIQDVIEY